MQSQERWAEPGAEPGAEPVVAHQDDVAVRQLSCADTPSPSLQADDDKPSMPHSLSGYGADRFSYTVRDSVTA